MTTYAAVIDQIAKQLDQFELTPVTQERIRECLNVLDLLAAAAMDAKAGEHVRTLTDAYDLVNHIGNRKAVL